MIFRAAGIIKFTFEPCGENHRPVLENLRRIQKVGKARFLAEQEELFADDKARYSWAFAEHEAGERWQRFERWMKRHRSSILRAIMSPARGRAPVRGPIRGLVRVAAPDAAAQTRPAPPG